MPATAWLEAGRSAEVREIALEMAWIFEAKKIAEKALAALRLFCDAAKKSRHPVAGGRAIPSCASRLPPEPARRPERLCPECHGYGSTSPLSMHSSR